MTEGMQKSWFSYIVLDNPIIRREALPRVLRRASPRGRWCVLASTLIAVALVGLYLRGIAGEIAPIIGLVALWAWAGLSVVVVALETSRAIGQERLAGSWDMLILSRLGGPAIVVGKLLAALLPLWAVGIAVIPFAALLCLGADPGLPIQIPIACAVAVFAGIAAASLGLWCSMSFRSIFTAQLVTAFIGWFTLQIMPIVAALVLEKFGMGLSEMPGTAHIMFGSSTILVPGFTALLVMLTRFHRLDRAFRRGRG